MSENKTNTFPCSNCGGDMKFSTAGATLKCPYCGTENEIPVDASFEIKENDFAAILATLEHDSKQETVEVVACQSCGAEVSMEGNLAANCCPYCNTSIVSNKHSLKKIKPAYLLPFAVDHDKAVGNFRKWLKSRWFMPSDAKNQAVRNELQGVYSPYWTYDSMTRSHYTGQRGTHYTVTERYTTTDANGKTVQKTRHVTKTRWTHVSGSTSRHFDDILVIGSNKLPRKYTRKLEPWDLENLVEYNHSYLSGFLAETYSIDLKAGFITAKELMAPEIRGDVRRDIGGDEQRIHSINTDYSAIKFKHILLPLWVSSFRYDDKIYNFLVNARTGEVQGERPWSIIKIALLIIAVIAIITAVFLLIKK
jgi:predicted RNA-binding Zn-ribbon protein involved in translation (DUF1610 family)